MHIIVDPPSHHYLANKLFDLNDNFLNRDGTLLPFYRWKRHLEKKGCTIQTVDKYDSGLKKPFIFISFSEPKSEIRHRHIVQRAKLSMLVLLEPELVRPRSYRDLSKHGDQFNFIFTHNINQLPTSLRHKYKHLFFPQPFKNCFKNEGTRLNKLVLVAGAHVNFFSKNENYSARIRAVGHFSEMNFIDLYGRGWSTLNKRQALNPTFRWHRRALIANYKGSIESKYECYSQYDYALCFENQNTKGYITEKIFDCLLSGCIPIYKGAPDITDFIPKTCFIDCNDFSSYQELYIFLSSMSQEDKEFYRREAEQYIHSESYLNFYNSLENMFDGVI